LMLERDAGSRDNRKGMATPGAISSRVSVLGQKVRGPGGDVLKLELKKPPSTDVLNWLVIYGPENVKAHARLSLSERAAAREAANALAGETLAPSRVKRSVKRQRPAEAASNDAFIPGERGGKGGSGDVFTLDSMMVKSRLHAPVSASATVKADTTRAAKMRHAAGTAAQASRHASIIQWVSPGPAHNTSSMSSLASSALGALSSVIGFSK